VNLLAIDPGTRCGWASSSGGRVESGVQEFQLGRGDSPGMRFIRFNAWLVELVDLTKPGLIVYERPHMRGGFATDLLIGLSTRIQELCAARGIEHEAVHSATLKKSATGICRADKAAMVGAARERFERSVKDDNEADALMLLDYAMRRGS